MEVNITTEFIKLGQFLKLANIIVNGAEAKQFLMNNKVTVNSVEENRRGKKLYNGDVVVLCNKTFTIISSFK